MGELEKWIQENRLAFDSEEPSDRVWEGIRKSKKQQVAFKPNYWKVAAMVLLAISSYLVYERQLDQNTQPRIVQVEDEHEQVESYYASQIKAKAALVAQFNDRKLTRTFLLEINRLDEQYKDLLRAYEYENESERLKDAMIQNLRLRMELLDRQLQILQAQNEKTNESKISI